MNLDSDDLDLDTVEAAPGFDKPPTGKYICETSVALKEFKDKNSDGMKKYVELRFKLVSVVEVADEDSDKPRTIGQQFSILTERTEDRMAYVVKPLKLISGLVGSPDNKLSSIAAITKENPALTLCTFKWSTSRGRGVNAGKTYDNFNLMSMVEVADDYDQG